MINSVVLVVGEETEEVNKIRDYLTEKDVFFEETEHDLSNASMVKLGVFKAPTVILFNAHDEELIRLLGFDEIILGVIVKRYKESITSEWEKAHYEFKLHKKRTGEENWYLLSHLKWGTGENYLERNWRAIQEQREQEKRKELFLKLQAEGKI
ncbi:hypothetical protein LD11_gp127 [Bacillus phage Riley]|uniref:Thioredoxin n=4 Tax=Caudoviricetes TaxID=2731619 RepID=A0A075LYP4_9CAUD|nr:hypothetical protein LD11_gp127 [Bacillus phage Riley]YP_009206487.1 hypothetical protein AVV02_gp132 [Bacillus phage AvesoBmore]ASZ75861.1 hypothetical protein TAFFO16_128 [Bacillus phage Taffo16]ULF48752.1 hypothetical protein [Bacillus phage BillyBob]AIF72003.1 hypothetical protein [Bacillus phage Riley]ALA13518.1 hypothetical protein AVESOBMORE_132 [Bacillus phage AvesoBmore]